VKAVFGPWALPKRKVDMRGQGGERRALDCSRSNGRNVQGVCLFAGVLCAQLASVLNEPPEPYKLIQVRLCSMLSVNWHACVAAACVCGPCLRCSCSVCAPAPMELRLRRVANAADEAKSRE
jgi:hypothetical protein